MKSLQSFFKTGAFSLLGLGLVTAPAQAVNITTSSDPNILVNNILGSGITISNATYQGASIASGIFTDGLASGIGIDRGIILTTGNAKLASGTNTTESASSSNKVPGDTDLSALISGVKTFDASVLEFEFTSTTGNLFFNYVFASEEYNEYVNSQYNDVFGFFLDGKNIALIPGTNTPVSINTVNGGNPFGSNATNPQLFNNNALSDGGIYNLQYDGFTNIFSAQFLGLSEGVHRLKIAIADVGDYRYDSAVFIQAGTFSAGELPKPKPTPVPQPTTPVPTPTPVKQVPEPTTIVGILASAAFGLTSLRKQTLAATKPLR
ncbi:choice-of-anchor L domain-containing protein [Nostoc sp. FACHB-87]|uniref:choice-of-anchor L family PEP-CTERM protein n=1 Tax=Nostocaceae TaxID=1162 RepID=UPI001687032C|nr:MULTISPECIES: choice-of-anchor L domain-containing protein [Nostocaceae]MBD2457271.1 choice-of-anchor L domain-containing protein [Nostoc sp. FACHB-87]MBD2477724.1 choice-of-anchor L domain-containing protein [Anabaena sp. FACHB-83]